MASGIIKIGETMQFGTPPSGVYSVNGFVKNNVAVATIVIDARSSGWFTNVNVGFPAEYMPPLELSTIGMPASASDASKISYAYLRADGYFNFYLTNTTTNKVSYTFIYPV